VLREIVRRRVGEEEAFRPKQGFTIPVEELLSRQWKHELTPLKDGTLLEKEGWLRPGSIRREVEQAETSQRVPQALWYVLVMEHWLRADKQRQTDSQVVTC